VCVRDTGDERKEYGHGRGSKISSSPISSRSSAVVEPARLAARSVGRVVSSAVMDALERDEGVVNMTG